MNAVAFADETTHILASAGDDGVCKIWDRRSLRESDPVPVGILAGHVDGVTYIDPRGDGRHLITNSKDQSIKLWDLRVFSPPDAVDETRRAVRNQVRDRNHFLDDCYNLSCSRTGTTAGRTCPRA